MVAESVICLLLSSGLVTVGGETQIENVSTKLDLVVPGFRVVSGLLALVRVTASDEMVGFEGQEFIPFPVVDEVCTAFVPETGRYRIQILNVTAIRLTDDRRLELPFLTPIEVNFDKEDLNKNFKRIQLPELKMLRVKLENIPEAPNENRVYTLGFGRESLQFSLRATDEEFVLLLPAGNYWLKAGRAESVHVVVRDDEETFITLQIA